MHAGPNSKYFLILTKIQLGTIVIKIYRLEFGH